MLSVTHRMATKTYPLEVDEDLWEDYKRTVPSSQNLDGPLIEYIKNRVGDDE